MTGSAKLAGHARFLPDRRRSRPAAAPAQNLVSEGAERTTIYFQDAPPAVALAVAATPGASHHGIPRPPGRRCRQRTLFDRTVAGPRCPVEPGLLGEGRYRWSAQPLDSEGLPVGKARLNRLELAYDNALDALAIRLPLPNQRLAGKTVEVAGVAPLGPSLFVNGTPAPLDDKGRLAAEAGRRPPRPRVPAGSRRRHGELLNPPLPAPALLSGPANDLAFSLQCPGWAALRTGTVATVHRPAR